MCCFLFEVNLIVAVDNRERPSGGEQMAKHRLYLFDINAPKLLITKQFCFGYLKFLPQCLGICAYRQYFTLYLQGIFSSLEIYSRQNYVFSTIS